LAEEFSQLQRHWELASEIRHFVHGLINHAA
jgi:hypothetical protein